MNFEIESVSGIGEYNVEDLLKREEKIKIFSANISYESEPLSTMIVWSSLNEAVPSRTSTFSLLSTLS